MALDLIAELEAVITALEREAIEYAVCGGLALGLHGITRATMDIDLLIRGESLANAMQAVRGAGFDIPARKMVFGLQSGQRREMQRLSKLDADTSELMAVDLLIVGPELEGVWADRVAMDVGGRHIVVVSRTGLATMKRIAGRPQDLVDLANLEGTSADDDSYEP